MRNEIGMERGARPLTGGPAHGSAGRWPWRRTARRIGEAALLALALGALTAPARGQETMPAVPGGSALAVLPVQTVRPTPGGAWPGGASSHRAAVEAMNAELDFAIQEDEEVTGWTSPGELVRQAGRNPLLGVDPGHLSFRGLEDEDVERLPDALHGQLRSLGALVDARMAVLPLQLWYEAGDDDDGEGGDEAATGRARLRFAVVDVRGGRILWTGEVQGARAAVDSPAALATLATRFVRALRAS